MSFPSMATDLNAETSADDNANRTVTPLSSSSPALRYRRLTSTAPSIIAGRHALEFFIVQQAGRTTTLRFDTVFDTELALGLPEGYNAVLSLPPRLRRSRVCAEPLLVDCAFRERLRIPLAVRKPWQIQGSNTLLVLRLTPIENYTSHAHRMTASIESAAASLRARLTALAAGQEDPCTAPVDPPPHAPRVDQSFDFDASWLETQGKPPRLIDLAVGRVSISGIPTAALFDTGSTQTSIDYDFLRRSFPNRRLDAPRTRVRGYVVKGSVSLPFTAAGVSWLQRFNVIINNPRPIVVGLDTMTARHIALDPAGPRPLTLTVSDAAGRHTLDIPPMSFADSANAPAPPS